MSRRFPIKKVLSITEYIEQCCDEIHRLSESMKKSNENLKSCSKSEKAFLEEKIDIIENSMMNALINISMESRRCVHGIDKECLRERGIESD